MHEFITAIKSPTDKFSVSLRKPMNKVLIFFLRN